MKGGFAMQPRYRVTLTEQERRGLEALTKTGKTGVKRFRYARALLLCDAGPLGPAWTVADKAEAMGVTPRTIEHRTPEEAPRGGRVSCGIEAQATGTAVARGDFLRGF